MTGNFAPNFSLNFLCISQAPLGWALWSGYYWKDLFHLQKLSIDDANFGPKWWRQKWKAKACHGSYRSHWVKADLLKKVPAIAWIHQILNLFDHEQYIFIFSQSWSDCFAERFVSNIQSMLDNRGFKHDFYGWRQSAKITSDFLLFSCKPWINHTKMEKSCLLLYAEQIQIFWLSWRQTGKVSFFPLVVCLKCHA